ncbi:MAG: hypothetical protein OEU32_02570 [Acidimicrobiia bacterium]|nr:hypothetical protein [Acidimicrobiia bacterium]
MRPPPTLIAVVALMIGASGCGAAADDTVTRPVEEVPTPTAEPTPEKLVIPGLTEVLSQIEVEPTPVPVDETIPHRTIATAEQIGSYVNVASFLDAWNASQDAAVAEGLEAVTIDPATVGRIDSELDGLDAFLVGINPGAFLGGTVDEATGEITGLMLVFDPDLPDRFEISSAFSAAMGMSTAATDVAGWAQILDDASTVDPAYTVTERGGVLAQVLAGAREDDPLAVITVASGEVDGSLVATVHTAIRRAASAAAGG